MNSQFTDSGSFVLWIKQDVDSEEFSAPFDF